MSRRLTGIVILVAAMASPLLAQSKLPDAVIYIERPEGGPAATSGRTVPSSGGVTIHSLDINSGVNIDIDSTKLADALAAQGIGTFTPQQKQLFARMVTLTNLMTQIDLAIQEVARVIDLFRSGTADDFRTARRASSGRILQMRESLRQAIAQRLTSEGMSASDADRNAKSAVKDLGLNENDWPQFRDLVSRELQAAQAAYNATAPNSGVSIEVQAHLVPRQGEPSAIALPGYNSVKPGPLSRFEKIRFEVPSEQQQIFDQMQKLAAKTADAKNLSQALLIALRSNVAASPIQAQLDKVQADAENVKKLADAIDSKSIDTFLKSVKDAAAQNNAADAQLMTDLTKLINDAKSAKSTFTELTNLSSFASSLKTADPVTALNQILGRFKTVTELPKELTSLDAPLKNIGTDLDKVKSSLDAATLTPAIKNLLTADTSPFAPLLADGGAVQTLIDDAKRLGEMIASFFHAETTATAVANLPVPEGQQRIPIEKNASTSFNLQTIAAPRNPGDTVQLGYAFYSGEQTTSSAGWTDLFELRLYGLSDKFAASLAMVRQTSQAKFKPTAAMSWLLTYQPWPTGTAERGKTAIRWFSGAGLTTMALDFDPNETAELGIAPTVSFLNDRLLIGYGWDLQAATHRSYAFFSLQLFSKSGFLGTPATTPAK